MNNSQKFCVVLVSMAVVMDVYAAPANGQEAINSTTHFGFDTPFESCENTFNDVMEGSVVVCDNKHAEEIAQSLNGDIWGQVTYQDNGIFCATSTTASAHFMVVVPADHQSNNISLYFSDTNERSYIREKDKQMIQNLKQFMVNNVTQSCGKYLGF